MNLDIDKYVPAIKKMATQMMKSLPDGDQYDDLVQAGLLGLVQAFNRFDDNRGIKFLTFAYPRIRGAMVDYLRTAGLRSKRFTSIKICSADELLEFEDTRGCGLQVIDDKDSFNGLTNGLKSTQELVIRKIYEDGLTQREVARELNVTDTWISELKRRALGNIRRKICQD